MGIFGRRAEESMDPQELLARGHVEMAESAAPDDAPAGISPAFRLTVADVFVIKGRGTVVTGMVESGTVRVGSLVRVERDGRLVAQTVIAGVETFRKIVDAAAAGENVGLLVPDLDRASVQSGDVLLSEAPARTVSR